MGSGGVLKLENDWNLASYAVPEKSEYELEIDTLC